MFSFIKRWRSRRNDVKASEAVPNQGVAQETASDEQLVPKMDALDVQIASATAGADFSFLPSSELPPGMVIVPGSMEASLVTTDSGRVVLRLANGDPKAHIRGTRLVGTAFVSRTRLNWRPAASRSGFLLWRELRKLHPSSRLAVAYSTNDVGNSGWRWFPVGQEWAELEMDYDVPPMKNGRGDFIGLLPDKQGAPAVEVSAVALRVNPVEKAGRLR